MRYRLLLIIPFISLWQVSYFYHLDRWVPLLISLLSLLLVRAGDYRFNRKVLYAFLYSALLIFMLVEPGIVYGRITYSSSGSQLWQLLTYSFLSSISVIAFTDTAVIKPLFRRPFAGIGLATLTYILSVIPLRLFVDLSSLPQMLLFDASFLAILGYYLGFLYLKTDMNIIPPIVFLSAYTLFTNLDINVYVSQYFNIVWEAVSIAVVLFVTDISIKESVRIRRAFRSRRNRAAQSRGIVPALFIGFVIIVVFLVVMPIVTHESNYVMADPTGSMDPVIHPGSLLFISQISVSQVSNGTIIVFHAPWSNGALFAHEVIGIQYKGGTEYFITKGIANSVPDPLPVPSTDLVGRVAFSVPYLGYALIYSDYLVLAILSVVAVMFASEIKK